MKTKKRVITTVEVEDAVEFDGIEVKIYQGIDGDWYASVLVDRDFCDEEDLPKHGNRPRIDGSTGRWWYDPACSVISWPKEERAGVTNEMIKERLIKKVADLVLHLHVIEMYPAMIQHLNEIAKPHHNPTLRTP